MLVGEEPVDLYKLFMVVKEKGGYDVVCKNRLWDLVGEEYGLGVKVGSSVELVYSKYLSTLETPLKTVVDSEFSECDLVDDRVKFGKCLMNLHAEFSLDDYCEEEVGDELNSAYDCGRKLCGTNRVKGVNPELNEAELEKVYDYLDERKLRGTNKVKDMNLESNGTKKDQNGGHVDLHTKDYRINESSLRKLGSHNDAMEIMEECYGGKILAGDVSDAVNNMPGLSDGGKRCDNDDGDDDEDGDIDDVLILDPSSVNRESFGRNNDVLILDPSSVNRESFGRNNDVLILDPSSVNRESFGRKRKRESMPEMLSWITSIAKDPRDSAVGSIPEKSKWKSYSNQEIWKQVLLFREAVFLKKEFESSSERLVWLTQRMMHPSMYDDNLGTAYNLRQRIKCDKSLSFGKSASDSSGGAQGDLEINPSSDTDDIVPIPVGPTHQAEVPEWTGMTCESDSKWLGTQIWPQKTVNSRLVERDPIGKGRQDSCGCEVQGSVECVRFHIAEKRAKVKLELGVAFYQWNLDEAGEEVRRFWTPDEEKKFKDAVKSNPASLDRCFWDDIFKTFPMKSRESLVSYYFNVFLLQRRGYQNRHTQDNIDSDDDESDYTPLRKVFGHHTNKSPSFTILSPKKPKTKGR